MKEEEESVGGGCNVEETVGEKSTRLVCQSPSMCLRISVQKAAQTAVL